MVTSIQQHSDFNHFEIITQLKREVRIKAPGLYQDPDRAKILEILLRKRDAVLSVTTVPDKASVAIQFDPVKLPLKNLFILLDTVLANIGSKVSKTMQQLNSYSAASGMGGENTLLFKITGMSCGCCAVSLEMNLKREPGIRVVNVDFASSTAKICGRLSQQKTIERIKKLGYTACVT